MTPVATRLTATPVLATPRRLALAQGALAFGVMLATIVAALLLNHRVVTAIDQSRDLVVRASAQAEAVREVVDALRDIEIGERGFLLTGVPAYLTPYTAGQRQLGTAIGRLRELVDGSPELGDEVRTLLDLARTQASEAARVVTLAGQGNRATATTELQIGGGRATMDEARDHVANLRQRIGAIHEARLREVREREAVASAAGVATAVVCAVLLGLAVLVLLRSRARLQRTQAALLDQTSRLSATMSHMRDGIAVFDRAGGLLLWNETFAGWVRSPPGGLRVGMRIGDISEATWPGATLRPASPGEPTLHEIQDGSRSFEVWQGQMPDGGQVLVVAEITRRARAEVIARQAQKMEALGQLTGGVAHDFNNLLHVVSANLELVVGRVADNPAVVKRLAAALAAVDRASQLTRRLLAFARRQPLAPKALDVASLLDGLDDMLRRTLGERIELRFELAPSLWPIRADPQQLDNAILNLVINGRDAIETTGRLTVAAANIELDAEYAGQVPEVAAGSYVAISITDTGTGMTAEQLGRALEPFYTTKPEGRGTGLGLPMVFGFAKQSHGHLQLISEPGRGTTARLFLPRSRAAPNAAAATAIPGATMARLVPARRLRVLLAEDDVLVRSITAELLGDLGHSAVQTATGSEALAALEPGADLLITDVGLPDMDGRQLAAWANERWPELRVIIASGREPDPQSPYGWLQKPYDAATLHSAIERATGLPAVAAPA